MTIKSENKNSDPSPDSYEIKLASLFYLMTRYARQPDQAVLIGINEYLQKIAAHPDQLSPFIIRTCERLIDQWLEMADTSTHSQKPVPSRSLAGNNSCH